MKMNDLKLVGAAACLAAMVTVSVAVPSATTGCTPAQSAEISKIEQAVLDGLTSGATLVMVENAVELLIPAGKDIDLLINDAISVLKDLGVLPPTLFSAAQSMQDQIAKQSVHRISTGKR
jgi:hypothetical protein